MSVQNRYLLLLNIEGFPASLRYEPESAAHAESILSTLLEDVACSADRRLVLHEVMPQGLYFSAESPIMSIAHSVLSKAQALSQQFEHSLRALVDAPPADADCMCSACASLPHLRLRIVLHHGKVAMKQVRQFRKPAGEPVILAHRLLGLGASLPRPEGLVLTQAFAALRGGRPAGSAEHQLEVDGFGPTTVVLASLSRSTQSVRQEGITAPQVLAADHLTATTLATHIQAANSTPTGTPAARNEPGWAATPVHWLLNRLHRPQLSH